MCGNALIMKTHGVTAPRGALSGAQSDFPVASRPLYKTFARWSSEFTNDDISVSGRLRGKTQPPCSRTPSAHTHDRSDVTAVRRSLVSFSKGRSEETEESVDCFFVFFYPLGGGYPGDRVAVAAAAACAIAPGLAGV